MESENSQVLRKLIDGRRQEIIGLAFCGNGLVSAAVDGNVTLWDIDKGEVKVTKDLKIAKLNAFALCNNTKRIFTGGSDGSLISLDTEGLREINSITISTGDITAIDCSPDAKWIAIGNRDKTISLWNQQTMTEVGRFYGHSARIASVRFSNDGLRLISASKDATVRLWDVERILFAGNNNSESDVAIRTALGELVDLSFHTNETTCASFSKSGNEILSASLDGYAVVWPSLPIPPAVRFSRSFFAAEINIPIFVDPNLIVSTPSAEDLDGCVVSFRLSPSQLVTERLSVTPDSDLEVISNSLRVRNRDGDFVEIGEVSEGEHELVISFKATATLPAVRKTVSRVAYTLLSATKDIMERELSLQIQNRHGKSANQIAEIMKIKLPKPLSKVSEGSESESNSGSRFGEMVTF